MNIPAAWGRVGYRIPGQPPVWLAGPVAENPDITAEGFWVAPFNSRQHPVLCIQPDIIAAAEDGFLFPLESMPLIPNIDKKDYERQVDTALGLIENGEVDKVVLSRSKSVGLAAVDPIAAFHQLCKQYPDAFCYLLWTPQSGCWIGATPERLISLEEGQWRTVALAGTLPVEGSRQWTEKEYAEQRWVSVYISCQLQMAGYDHGVGQREEIVAGRVKHLVTPITIRGGQQPPAALPLAALLHPTPAICGLPVEKAQKLIEEIEQRDRAYYTGYLGPVGVQGEHRLYVNLRCGQLWRDGVTVQVGGGIVAGSHPDIEWEETNYKATTLLSVLEQSS